MASLAEELSQPLVLHCSQHVIELRQLLRDISNRLEMGMAAKSRLIMCVTELAENAIKHGGGGWCEIGATELPDGMNQLNISIRDTGPGISKLSHVLGERFDVETNPMGTGLAGVRRVADFFDIESSERGTYVSIGFSFSSQSGYHG